MEVDQQDDLSKSPLKGFVFTFVFCPAGSMATVKQSVRSYIY